MISEPELDDGDGFVISEVLAETPPSGPPRARRPWLWALGGAVVASAVWGGGLYAYEKRQDAGPDLGGYKPVEKLCELAKLEALGAVLGKRIPQDFVGPFLDEPALSESSCQVGFGRADVGPSVSIRYTLHKVVDPGPEFAAQAQRFGTLQKVDGIGEQAFFDNQQEQGGMLVVLDGQAEIQFQIFTQTGLEANGKPVDTGPPVDFSGIDVPMTQDMLALMAALKK